MIKYPWDSLKGINLQAGKPFKKIFKQQNFDVIKKKWIEKAINVYKK